MIFTMIKVSKSLKIEHVMLLTLSKQVFFIFFRNESKSIKHNNLYTIRRRSVEITKKKNLKTI